MKHHRFEKTQRIVSELMLYCHQLGCTTCHIDTELQPELAIYRVQAPIAAITDEELEQLARVLNQPRQPQIEETYWMLGGQSDSHSQLMLVGMMVDEAEVVYQDGVLQITVRRKRGSTTQQKAKKRPD